MNTATWGVVQNGVVVPQGSLPDGAWVQLTIPTGPIELTPEEREEFEMWQMASAKSFEHIERLEQESEAHEEG